MKSKSTWEWFERTEPKCFFIVYSSAETLEVKRTYIQTAFLNM